MVATDGGKRIGWLEERNHIYPSFTHLFSFPSCNFQYNDVCVLVDLRDNGFRAQSRNKMKSRKMGLFYTLEKSHF